MKKTAIIIVLLSALLFSVFTAASAADSKEEYYLEISCALSNIDYNLQHDNPEEAQVWAVNLRTSLYAAAKFLVAENSFDLKLFEAIGFVDEAFANQAKKDLVIHYIALARNNVAMVLLGHLEDYIDDACNFTGRFEETEPVDQTTSSHS